LGERARLPKPKFHLIGLSRHVSGALKMEDRKKQDRNLQDQYFGNAGPENAGPENVGLDFEGPFRRSNGLICCEVV